MKLNPDLTFETLIPTTGNWAALEACWQFANLQGSNFLLLHSPPAVGRTHLLHAIYNQARCLQPELRVWLLTCETWINDLITAIRTERTEEFRNKYRQIKTQQFLADFIVSLVMEGCRVALAHSGPLSPIPFLVAAEAAKSEKKNFVEVRPPTSEEMHRVLLSRFAIHGQNISLNAVKAACMYACGDIRRAEGRLNSVLLQRKFTRKSSRGRNSDLLP